jgi:hypothetical protein
MITIDLSERSTWRGAVMAVAGAGGLYLIIPEIMAISQAESSAQLGFALEKVTALASGIGLAGQTASGLIGMLFGDKGKSDV